MIKSINKAINKYQSIDKVILILFFISIIALPSNLSKTWRIPTSYYQGIFYENWSIKLYLSQIILILTFLLTSWHERTKYIDKLAHFLTRLSEAKKRPFLRVEHLVLLILMGIIITQGALTPHSERFYIWIMALILGPAIMFILLKKDVFIRFFPSALLISTSLQCGVATLQYVLQKNLFPYRILGETQLSQPLFLAKSTMRSVNIVLPYGTTPHPNILAGWLIVGITALFFMRKHLNIQLFYILLILYLFTLLLTESLSAWASLLPIMVFFLWKDTFLRIQKMRKITFFGIVVVNALAWTMLPLVISKAWPDNQIPLSIARRSQPLQKILEEPSSRFLYGSGLGKSFPELNSSEDQRNLWKFPQPIHNSGIILVYELGICILLLLLFYYIFVLNNYSINSLILITFLPIFYLDHYLTSHIMGQYIVIIFWTFFALEHTKKKA